MDRHPEPASEGRVVALEYRVELMDIALGSLDEQNARLKAQVDRLLREKTDG